MDSEIRKIEKYFIENKNPKDLINNIKAMNRKELIEIVK